MTVLRALAVLLALTMAWPAAPVSAQQPHWLVGTWDGERKNVSTRNRTGTERSLVVTSVAADGASARAKWITGSNTINVTLGIAGDVVSFTTPGAQGNSYRLVRKGDALEGSWTSQGRGNSGAMALYRQ